MNAKQSGNILVLRAEHVTFSFPCRSGKRREIDVASEISLAGFGQRIEKTIRSHRLKRVADTGGGMAIVDDQGRAIRLADAPRDVVGNRL